MSRYSPKQSRRVRHWVNSMNQSVNHSTKIAPQSGPLASDDALARFLGDRDAHSERDE